MCCVQGFFMIPYRLFSPTFFPLFTMLRKLRILPCKPPSQVSFSILDLVQKLSMRRCKLNLVIA